ncbi:MAG: metalloregulator ArsR/SmtB family transcription factor [Lachnospiraceae bacterium]|nr:metalloregulator ArsR/SmtB family transcription factor [Lachnospiraceae bacterium]
MTDEEAVKIFKCLSDKSRVQILKSLVQEPMYVERLAERLSLTPSTISFHLKKMMDANIVNSKKEQYYAVYSINEEILSCRMIDILKEESTEGELQKKREEEYRNKVLQTFFDHGKLLSIPVQRKKERIVLEKIAESFEAGRKYTEREVNITIADFHDDFCTIRRDMVAEGLLERTEDSIYTRRCELQTDCE